jgi:hypothetical protein
MVVRNKNSLCIKTRVKAQRMLDGWMNRDSGATNGKWMASLETKSEQKKVAPVD